MVIPARNPDEKFPHDPAHAHVAEARKRESSVRSIGEILAEYSIGKPLEPGRELAEGERSTASQAASNQNVRQYLGSQMALLAEYEQLEAAGNESAHQVLEAIRHDIRQSYASAAAELAAEDDRRLS